MGTIDGFRIMVTGATGFLGSAVVEAALSAGHAVTAVARTAEGVEAASWRGRPGVSPVVIDLAGADARRALNEALEGIDCVVHAALAKGDLLQQQQETIEATATLIGAMTGSPRPPRLVLISSLCVYNYASMPAGSHIDETTPLEPEPEMRDAYCQAKLAQEAQARRAAKAAGLRVRALRPGIIIGPRRLQTARLGFGLGPVLLMPGGGAPLPLIAIEDCVALTLSAMQAPTCLSDISVRSGDGGFEAINLVGKEQPSQADYARLLAAQGWPRVTLRVPLWLARFPAQAFWLVGLLLPALARRVPGVMRLESFDARFKALGYSTARAADRLGFLPSRSVADIVRRPRSAGERP